MNTKHFRHTILLLFAALGLLIISAFRSSTDSGSSVGLKAPRLSDAGIESLVKNDELHGRYVLVTFWSTGDAASRSDANRYDSWYSRVNPDNISYIGINFDDNDMLFREIVRRDSLNGTLQYRVSGIDAAAIARNYNLHQGYGSILIDPKGNIVSINPTETTLNSYAA